VWRDSKRLRRRGPVRLDFVAVDLSASTATQTIARLTFGGASTEFGSLVDGLYRHEKQRRRDIHSLSVGSNRCRRARMQWTQMTRRLWSAGSDFAAHSGQNQSFSQPGPDS
jgi:hypothetical protein